jgi:hypothetical protein
MAVFKNKKLIPPLGVALACAVSACQVSKSPQIMELEKILPPTFNGLTYQRFTTPSHAFVLKGECSAYFDTLEMSTDQRNWTAIAHDCPNSETFKTTVQVETVQNFYFRGVFKGSTTDSANAWVRFTLPPTSPTSIFLTAGGLSPGVGPGVDISMGHSLSGNSMSSAAHNIHMNLPGIVHAQ